MCGEQLWDSDYRNVVKGSSPRVRGTEFKLNTIYGFTGIIPACAGNRGSSAFATSQNWDHPRVCGEQHAIGDKCIYIQGSSPRVRGTATVSPEQIRNGGIIPACAGNRLMSKHRTKIFRDHPRVCGEQTKDPQLNITHPS